MNGACAGGGGDGEEEMNLLIVFRVGIVGGVREWQDIGSVAFTDRMR